ncbi:MAG: ligase-associated DNA damage response endonuclease PdeM [Ignavibacteria bacterium]
MSLISSSVRIVLHDIEMTLLPDKAIYFVKEKILLASDLHIGKTGHFRNAGIPIPAELAFADLNTLDRIFDEFEIEKFIILGDLFHAELNFDWRILAEWRENYKQLQIQLVKGNHDILQESIYKELNIEVFKSMVLNKFLFIHNFNHTDNEGDFFKICGHIHPAVRLHGKGRQAVTMPCFYFGNSFGILPAFGRFTGKYIINPKQDQSVFIITGDGDDKRVLKM